MGSHDPTKGAAALPPGALEQAKASSQPDTDTDCRWLDALWRPVGSVNEIDESGVRPPSVYGWLDGSPPRRRHLLVRDVGDDAARRIGLDEPEIPFLPMGKVAMLAAAGGAGKSYALIQLAIAVATGTPWLATEGGEGGLTVKEPGRVLLALGEEDEAEIHRRLGWVLKARGLDRDDDVRRRLRRLYPLPLYSHNVALLDGSLNPSDFAKALESRLCEDGEPWSAVILDPASRFMGPEAETDNQAATWFVESLERLTLAPGNPAVIIAHHMNKDGVRGNVTDQTAARGSSAFTDGVRWQANLEPVGRNFVNLNLVKLNHVPPHEPICLKRAADGVLVAAEEAETEEAAMLSAVRRAAEKARKKEREALAAAAAEHVLKGMDPADALKSVRASGAAGNAPAPATVDETELGDRMVRNLSPGKHK